MFKKITIISGQVTHKYADLLTRKYFVGFSMKEDQREEVVDNLTYQKAQRGDTIEIKIIDNFFISKKSIQLK